MNPRRSAPAMLSFRTARWTAALALAAALWAPAFGQDQAEANATTEPPTLQIDLGAHGGAVRRIAADAGRGVVVTGSDDKTARSWSLDSSTALKVFRPAVGEGEHGRVYGVALHPTQPWVALGGTGAAQGGNSINVHDVHTGQLVRRVDAQSGEIKRLQWSSDGRWLVAAYAGANVVRAFDAQGVMVFSDTFPARVLALAASPGRLAAASFDGSLRVYEVGPASADQPPIRLRASRQVAGGVASLAFSPDGQALAVGYMATGTSSLGHAPDIVEWARGSVRSLPVPQDMKSEDLRAVAWLAPGGQVVAAGSYGYSRRDVRLLSYDAARGQLLSTRSAARASVTDIAALPDNRLVYAAADGSWGSADAHPQHRPTLRPSRLPDLVGAGHLRVSEDGKRISWNLAGDQGRVMFNLDRHTLHAGQGADLPVPVVGRGAFNKPLRWEDFPDPVVNGRPIALQEGERSRAVAHLAPGNDAVLGTSRGLYRIGGDGHVVWRVTTHTEVRAVHVARQGQLIVTAMLDGTVRLWNSRSGKELLALLVLPDERWVAWTPSGYYDATPRAEDLIGWRVGRGRDHAADFFHASRFKARFYRPDIVDQVLDTLDESQGVQQANAEVRRSTPLTPLEQALPPVVELISPGQLSTSARQLVLRVRLRTADSAPLTGLWVRINKQYQPIARTQPRPTADGTGAERDLTVTLPMQDAEVQVFAENRHGVAEPARVAVRWTGAPPPAQAPEAVARLPNLYVLAIGISAYQHVQPLKYADKDALVFADTMRAQQGLMYGRVTTKVLVNDQASRDEVVDGLDWLQRQVTQNDIAMIFISGHGVNDATMGYTFLPANADPSKLRSTGVPTEEIRRTVSRLVGKSVLFFDTCHAGNALRFGRKAVNDMTGVISELLDTENGVVVFSASTGRQFSHEHDDWKHGAFTKALVEGLAGQADATGSGRVTHTALAYFISERVKQLTNGEQSPIATADNVADFPLAVVRAGGAARAR